MEGFDFSNATVDQFKVAGIEEQPTEQAPELAQTEQAPTEQAPVEQPPVEQNTPTPVETAPVEQAPVAQAPQEYTFKDEFIKNLVKYYEEGGDLTAYVAAKTTDFDAMTEEQIARRALQEEFPDFPPEAFETLYKKRVIEKYGLDPDSNSEEDILVARELFKRDMAKKRAEYKEWQAKFTAPDRSNEDAELQRQYEESLRNAEREVRNNEVTQKFIGDKRIVVKTAAGDINFDVPNPEHLVEMTLDSNKFYSQFLKDGKVDLPKWYEVAAIAANKAKYDEVLISHGKALGREEVMKEIKNPEAPGGAVPATGNTGDARLDLLNAFATRGVHK